MERKFRTSNIDLVSYLLYLNIKYDVIELTKSNKVMFQYDYEFKKLIKIQNDFNTKSVFINMSKYSAYRKKITDIVKLTINK